MTVVGSHDYPEAFAQALARGTEEGMTLGVGKIDALPAWLTFLTSSHATKARCWTESEESNSGWCGFESNARVRSLAFGSNPRQGAVSRKRDMLRRGLRRRRPGNPEPHRLGSATR